MHALFDILNHLSKERSISGCDK